MSEKYVRLDIEWLFEATWNYKDSDDDLMEKLIKNIHKNDQIENLIVREIGKRYEVVNGNHRLKAMRHLGFTTAMCYNLGEISDHEAKMIALETNETKFHANGIALAELLKELTSIYDIDEMAETLPYTDGEIENYIDLLDHDYGNLGEEELGPVAKQYDMTVTIGFAFNDESIVEEIQKVVDKYPSAVIK